MTRTSVAAMVLAASLLSLPASAAPTAAGERDHDQMVGKFGLSYFGAMNVPLASAVNGPGVDAQLVGVRYWLDNKLGIDAALGLGLSTGSTKFGGSSTDLATPSAFALMAGVPFALASGQHYTFFAEPEIRLGFAGRSATVGGTKIDDSGFRFDFGARAGAELQFGFIGIPQLALDATVSLLGTVRSGSTKTSGAPDQSFSTFTFATDLQNQPWNIFFTNVVVRYYF